MERSEISRNQIINQLINISHGNFMDYADIGLKAAEHEPGFLAHAIAWNEINGKIRDSKIALPVIATRTMFDKELIENAIAHLCLRSPKNFMRAVKFHKVLGGLVILDNFDEWLDMQIGRSDLVGYLAEASQNHVGRPKSVHDWPGFMSKIENLHEDFFNAFKIARKEYIRSGYGYTHKNGADIAINTGALIRRAAVRYVRVREKHRKWWNNTALSHRRSLKEIYKYFHIKPAPFAQKILFEGHRPKGSIFEDIYNLKNMNTLMAAGTILKHNTSFLVVKSAISNLEDKPEIVLALLETMSRTDLITNTKWLSKLGVFEKPELKAAYDAALERTKGDKKTPTMKISKAVHAVKDESVKKKLKKVQEDELDSLGNIEGNWLILADKSSSMGLAIEKAKMVASFIARQIKGEVWLVFFNESPTAYNVTGKTYEQVVEMTKRESETGWTSVGVGLDYILQRNILINGILICSDGGENTKPLFPAVYKKYVEKMGIEPTVYMFYVKGTMGHDDVLTPNCLKNDIMVEKQDVTDLDYYSLPNAMKILKARRYKLIDEIMETPLLTLDKVFKSKLPR